MNINKRKMYLNCFLVKRSITIHHALRNVDSTSTEPIVVSSCKKLKSSVSDTHKLSNVNEGNIINAVLINCDKVNENPLAKSVNIPINKSISNIENNKSVRYNEFNIQMISKNLFNQLFKNSNTSISTTNVSQEVIDKYIQDLKKHNLLNKQEEVSDIELNLPKFDGKNITEHFWNIGEKQSGPYRKLLEKLINNVPEIPKTWLFEPGWVRYTKNGYEKVAFPKEDALVLDVEVCLSEGDMPTLGTAVSNEAWYGWVSPDLVHDNKKTTINRNYATDRLIPLESNEKEPGYKLNNFLKIPRIVVGHNVSFDRARVKEQYWLEKTGLRFMDTMSMHVSVSGVTSYQRALLKSNNAGENDWRNYSSLNSLSKVHELYCGSELAKEKRDTFITGTLNDVRNELLIK